MALCKHVHKILTVAITFTQYTPYYKKNCVMHIIVQHIMVVSSIHYEKHNFNVSQLLCGYLVIVKET